MDGYCSEVLTEPLMKKGLANVNPGDKTSVGIKVGHENFLEMCYDDSALD